MGLLRDTNPSVSASAEPAPLARGAFNKKKIIVLAITVRTIVFTD